MKRIFILLSIIFIQTLTSTSDISREMEYKSILQEAKRKINCTKNIDLTFGTNKPYFSEKIPSITNNKSIEQLDQEAYFGINKSYFSKIIPSIATITNNKNNDAVINIDRTLLDKEAYSVKKFLIFYHVANIAITDKNKKIESNKNNTLRLGFGFALCVPTTLYTLWSKSKNSYNLLSLAMCFFTGYNTADYIFASSNKLKEQPDMRSMALSFLKCEDCITEIIEYNHNTLKINQRIPFIFLEHARKSNWLIKCKFHKQQKNINN